MPRADSVLDSPRKAFTLIEVITVMVAIAVLSSLLFAVGAGWNEKSKREKARADMAIIQQALEEYRGKFGDYPRENGSILSGDSQVMLFNALCGKIAPGGIAVNVKPMLNYAPLSLGTNAYPNHNNDTWVQNLVLDPWGTPYQYRYDPADGSWENYRYLLFSAGPDSLFSESSSGEKNPSDSDNADNLYGP